MSQLLQLIRTRSAVAALTVAGLIAAVGCGGSDPNRNSVSGTVSFKGQPVPSGTIYFEPDTAAGGSGPQGIAIIQDGKYATATDKGVGTGTYKVRIVGLDGVPATMAGEELPDGKPLFPPYETTVDMPGESFAKDFDVPAVESGK